MALAFVLETEIRDVVGLKLEIMIFDGWERLMRREEKVWMDISDMKGR